MHFKWTKRNTLPWRVLPSFPLMSVFGVHVSVLLALLLDIKIRTVYLHYSIGSTIGENKRFFGNLQHIALGLSAEILMKHNIFDIIFGQTSTASEYFKSATPRNEEFAAIHHLDFVDTNSTDLLMEIKMFAMGWFDDELVKQVFLTKTPSILTVLAYTKLLNFPDG